MIITMAEVEQWPPSQWLPPKTEVYLLGEQVTAVRQISHALTDAPPPKYSQSFLLPSGSDSFGARSITPFPPPFFFALWGK